MKTSLGHRQIQDSDCPVADEAKLNYLTFASE